MIQNFWEKSPVKIFENEKFGKVRTVDYNNEIWFVAKDVCDVLELTNATMSLQRLDSDEVTKFNLGSLQGECDFLTENGLYEVLMQSRKPIAKKFKKEVKNILHEIRLNGEYKVETFPI